MKKLFYYPFFVSKFGCNFQQQKLTEVLFLEHANRAYHTSKKKENKRLWKREISACTDQKVKQKKLAKQLLFFWSFRQLFLLGKTRTPGVRVKISLRRSVWQFFLYSTHNLMGFSAAVDFLVSFSRPWRHSGKKLGLA